MQQYRSTRTHIIYRYKGREAVEVGGHAVQEITTRAPDLAGGQKRIMQHMRFLLSVLPVGLSWDRRREHDDNRHKP